MKIIARINSGYSARKLLKKDDLVFKELGESFFSGWHKLDIHSNILKNIYEISGDRGMGVNAYITPVFSAKEHKQFTHFVPGFLDLKLTESRIKQYRKELSAFDLTDCSGIGRVLLPPQISLKFPIKINTSEIRRICYHSEELIAGKAVVEKLNHLGADLSDCPLAGISASGEEIFMLKTKHFASSVTMNETITDRLGFEREAKQIENRYYQSGSRCYENLSTYGMMTRTIDSLSMQESPPWIIDRKMVDFVKEHKISCGFDPVFEIGTPICDEYLAVWREFMDLVLLNPSNWVKFG